MLTREAVGIVAKYYNNRKLWDETLRIERQNL